MPSALLLPDLETTDYPLGAPAPRRYDCRVSGLGQRPRFMSIPPATPQGSSVRPLTAEATVDLLLLVKQGDEDALNRLIERCLPALRRWAHGRLPQSARSAQETADVVQDAVLSALRRIEAFEPRHQGALQAYLRQAVMNRIRDIMRQRGRRPEQTELPEALPHAGASPLEQAIGAENLARYEQAIARLDAGDREAIVGRIEMQYSYPELAVALDKPSPDAARMAVTRAMKRLAEEMTHV